MDLLQDVRINNVVADLDGEVSKNLTDLADTRSPQDHNRLIFGRASVGGKMSLKVKYKVYKVYTNKRSFTNEVERTFVAQFIYDSGEIVTSSPIVFRERLIW